MCLCEKRGRPTFQTVCRLVPSGRAAAPSTQPSLETLPLYYTQSKYVASPSLKLNSFSFLKSPYSQQGLQNIQNRSMAAGVGKVNIVDSIKAVEGKFGQWRRVSAQQPATGPQNLMDRCDLASYCAISHHACHFRIRLYPGLLQPSQSYGVVKYQGHKQELSKSIALHHFASMQIHAIDSVSDQTRCLSPPYRWPGGQRFARLILRSTVSRERRESQHWSRNQRAVLPWLVECLWKSRR